MLENHQRKIEMVIQHDEKLVNPRKKPQAVK